MSWEEIKNQVEGNGNVLTVTMKELRDAEGAGKLGPQVAKNIRSKLAGIGLGHVPIALPGYQNEFVRLYKKGTPVGDLIRSVLNPGEQQDTFLRERFGEEGGPDYAGMIELIREVVEIT